MLTRPPRLSLIVSTIGRTSPLVRLLHSLVKQQCGGEEFELVLVDQSADGDTMKLVEQLRPPIRWSGTRTEPGVSLGRNAGAAMAAGDVLAFPDDDCWYDPSTVATAAKMTRSAGDGAIISGRQLTGDGRPSMLRWPKRAKIVDRRDVWRAAISSTLFVPRHVFDAVSGFNEWLGVGAPTPWQAGEDTDLLLRAMAAGFTVRYEPSLQVYQADPRHDGADLTHKMAGYGRGVGRVLALNRYPSTYVARIVARKRLVSAARLALARRRAAAADVAWANGVWHGYHDRATA